MKALIPFLLSVCVFSSLAYAQTIRSTSEILKNKKFEDTLEITDSKMRADLGSMSRYSFKFDMSYFGPAVGKPFEKDLPNPDHMVRVNATNLRGSISGRYRLDSNSALFVAGGLSALYPFHGMSQFNVNTPTFGYDMFHRLGEAQVRNAFGASVETVPTYLAVGVSGGLNYIGSVLFDLGASGFATGMDLMFFYKLYNREYRAIDGFVQRYTGILAPSLKYNFSDRWSMSTNVGFAFWNPRFIKNETALWPQTITQKLGVGYAFSKAVYVSPYLNFYPAKVAMDTSTINISTVFSIL